MKKRIQSFVWGGLAAFVFIAWGVISAINTGDIMQLLSGIILGITPFTFISCLILGNNFIGEMMLTIFSWGFVRMPGVIFTLDLDGLIWLLTVKLLFWALEFVLAAIAGIFAVILGFIMSVFVYPFAIYKNIKYGDTESEAV